eukprot:jgi/Mesen1/622/ME000108S10779
MDAPGILDRAPVRAQSLNVLDGDGVATRGRGGRRKGTISKSKFHQLWQDFRRIAFRKEMLVFWTLGGVVLGLTLGFGLYPLHPSKQTVELIWSGAGLGWGSESSRATRYAVTYYGCSMLLAVAQGIALVLLIRPGKGSPLSQLGDGEGGSAVQSVLSIGRQLVPPNIVMAAAQAQYLGVIAFCIFFGSVLASLGEQAEPLIRVIEIANAAVLKMILAVIWLTPVGVGSLIAGTVLRACHLAELASSLALYVATILTGFVLHTCIVLPTLLRLFTGRNPFHTIRAFFPAFAMGFGTASSAATMPVTMECAVSAGCEDAVVRFVVPLGTNINRDGAALYEAATALFIAQAHGVELSVGMVVIVAMTATLAAVGGASVPMGALVSMITVLQAVGLERYIQDISVVMAVDWAIGMFRTVVNIWGDSCATVIVDSWLKARSRDQEEEWSESDTEDSEFVPLKGDQMQRQRDVHFGG